jgi:hypothetical protein
LEEAWCCAAWLTEARWYAAASLKVVKFRALSYPACRKFRA